jgi:four helix bundle protein
MGLVKKGHEVYWLTSAKEVESGDDQKLNADGIKVHRFSYFEFIQFLYVAKCSASELQSQLYIASDLKYIPDADFKALYGLSEETIKLISGFIKYLKGS